MNPFDGYSSSTSLNQFGAARNLEFFIKPSFPSSIPSHNVPIVNNNCINQFISTSEDHTSPNAIHFQQFFHQPKPLMENFNDDKNLMNKLNFMQSKPLRNQFIDSAGTIFLSYEDEIPEVNMVDDYDYGGQRNVNFFALDDKLSGNNIEFNANDEQEYWKNTRDCDYRFLMVNNNNNLIKDDKSNHISAKTKQRKHNCKHRLSRKKLKKLKKQTEGINLARPVAEDENINIDIDLKNIDELEVNDLINYYKKLKKELTILNVANNSSEMVALDEESLTKDCFSDFDQISDDEDLGINEHNENRDDYIENINDSNLNIEEIPKPYEPSDSATNITKENINDENRQERKNFTLNENLLRERLIRTLLEKRILEKENSTIYPNSDDRNLDKSSVRENSPKCPKTILDLPKLVIHISESEDDSQSDDHHSDEDIDEDVISGSKTISYINKLSKSQQNEYQKLKKEIERRESQSDYLNKNLQDYELKLKNGFVEMEQKKKKIHNLNQIITEIKKKLKKSQNHMQNIKKIYLAAEKNVEFYTVKLKLVFNEMKKFRQNLIEDDRNIKHYKNLCLNFGHKLYGNQYKLPNIQILDSTQKITSETNLKKKNSILNSKNNKLQSARNLRNKFQSLLTISYSSDTVTLLAHCVNFNFNVFRHTKFFQYPNTVIPFSDFTKNSSELLDTEMLKQYDNKINFEDENYQSVLMHFNSYRFFHSYKNDISTDFWANALNPNEIICHYDLTGSCNDVKCQFQHQKDYLYNSSQEKILDILTYSHEFANQINVEEFKENPKLLQEKLDSYFKEKQIDPTEYSFEYICRQLSEMIRNDPKISVTSLLIRLFPKDWIKFSVNHQLSLVSSLTKVPFEDYIYKFYIRDDLFDLKFSQLVNFTLENDPDFYIKNRFFAPEGVPVTAQLESSLSADPSNIQMWINLAYYHLSKIIENKNNLDYCFDSALNVLSRALESNPNNSELYEHYLLFYVNKWDLMNIQQTFNNRKDILSIQVICRRILKYCSTYRLWIRYLNLCYSIEEKTSISMEIIEQYMHNNIQYSSDEERSFNLLEILFYRINLLLHQGQHEESVKFFNDTFNNNYIESSETMKNTPSSFILRHHRVFAWHCYIHLILYQCLPYHCFQLSKRGCFLQLINTEPFIFNWRNDISVNDLKIIKNIFKRALKNCCSDNILKCSCSGNNPMDTCFSLRLNLTNLNKILIKNISEPIMNEDDNLENLFLFNENCQVLTNLHILHMFEINLQTDGDLAYNEMLNLIENSNNKDRFINNNQEYVTELTDDLLCLLESHLKFNYWLAFYRLKLKNLYQSKETLKKNLTYYFVNPNLIEYSDDCLLLRLYEVILFEPVDNDFLKIDHITSKFKFKNDKRAHYLVYLYLSYLLYIHICLQEKKDYNPDQHYFKLDCVFSSVINSFSSKNPQARNLAKVLWFNYFLLLLDFPHSDTHFKIIYENLRHICLNFNSSDPIFVYNLINSVSEFINPSDKLYFLVNLCKLNPDNINLVLRVFNMALKQQKKETLWNLIIYIVYQKKIRLQCLEFWKIVISLSVERNDHLNTHKFFQIAISLMPYNTILWEMFKNYETNANHQEHLYQMKLFLSETIRMPTLI